MSLCWPPVVSNRHRLPNLVTEDSPMSANPAPNPQVTLETSMGTLKIELYQDKAPVTVKNFLDYVAAGHFNGTIFHRVIPNFMVQGGGFEPGMRQKPTRDP